MLDQYGVFYLLSIPPSNGGIDGGIKTINARS
jgi:hypothetical protein